MTRFKARRLRTPRLDFAVSPGHLEDPMRSSTHSTLRRLVGTSVVVLATAVPAGAAAAADYPSGNPPAVNPNTASNSAPNSGSTVRAATSTRPSTLPFTGGDIAGLALIGAGAAIAGTVMVRRSRRTATG
jgi:hypothetical protein